MEFSKSQRGNVVLLYKGFEYLKTKENTTTGVTIWRCRQFHSRNSNCHAMLKTKDEEVFVEPSTHSHDSCPQKAQANIAMCKMKEEMRVSGASTSIVMENVLSNLSSEVLLHIPKPSSLTRNLLRQRTDQLPNPHTPISGIPEQYSHLILYDSGEDDPDRLIAVGDMDLLLQLDTDIIYGDGTFDKLPTMFTQLYSWHAKVESSYPACVYFLLRRKNLETYNKMLEVLKEMLPELSPQKIMLDFDRTCIHAVRTAFPNVELKGCYFQLRQCLIKKINSVGLKSEYKGNKEIKMMLKSLAALAFVPAGEVRDVFDILAATFPDEENFNDVLACFLSFYIGAVVSRNPQFPIRFWNHFKAVVEKTPGILINGCEEFHKVLSSHVHCRRPSVWHLFDGLQKDISYQQLTLINDDEMQPVKRTKYEKLHDRVAKIVQGYQDEKNKLKYLRTIARLL